MRAAAEPAQSHLLVPSAMKYTIPRIRSTPEKIRKVTLVPTVGIVTNVGRKVPIMLPTVLNASSLPTVLPLSSIEPIVYLTSEGVTVPSRKRGKTNITMQDANAAAMR